MRAQRAVATCVVAKVRTTCICHDRQAHPGELVRHPRSRPRQSMRRRPRTLTPRASDTDAGEHGTGGVTQRDVARARATDAPAAERGNAVPGRAGLGARNRRLAASAGEERGA
jgi:hypothetical protein